ncbi:hypothetical protein EYC84_008748 [Monilinia fructicola]|uniref:MARVEL domain-containing protein n=1 Tax=Monilinia fructicola TaxID=38448 RepID=A0A5M9JG74_MONFR|nr:hypothetical protein EYC84_008748 [Monilinia fructicola]
MGMFVGNFARDDPHSFYVKTTSQVPVLPSWLTILRCFQLLLAFVILILTAFASTKFPSSFFPGYGKIDIKTSRIQLTQVRTLEVTLVVFYLTTFALLASEIPLWNAFDDKSWTKSLDKTLVSAARASKAAVALSFIQFITLVVSMGFLAYAIHTYLTASTNKSVHARQDHSSNLSHHNTTPPSSYFPSTPHLLSRSGTPSSPRPVFSRQDRPISLPVLQKRPEIGGTYRMRETYDRKFTMQSEYKDGERRKEVRAHGEMAWMESSEDDDDERRTDFSPAFV